MLLKVEETILIFLQRNVRRVLKKPDIISQRDVAFVMILGSKGYPDDII